MSLSKPLAEFSSLLVSHVSTLKPRAGLFWFMVAPSLLYYDHIIGPMMTLEEGYFEKLSIIAAGT